jgi:hypothetical protein
LYYYKKAGKYGNAEALCNVVWTIFWTFCFTLL